MLPEVVAWFWMAPAMAKARSWLLAIYLFFYEQNNVGNVIAPERGQNGTKFNTGTRGHKHLGSSAARAALSKPYFIEKAVEEANPTKGCACLAQAEQEQLTNAGKRKLTAS